MNIIDKLDSLLGTDADDKGYAALLDELSDKEDASSNYVKGLLWYSRPNSDNTKAIYYFNKVLEVQPKHVHALLYIGHCLFDGKLWKECISYFKAVEEHHNVFKEHQTWRLAKNAELLAVSYLRTGSANRFWHWKAIMWERYEALSIDEVPLMTEFQSLFNKD
jgi:tetratricopeptide (TPR) repeat protein